MKVALRSTGYDYTYQFAAMKTSTRVTAILRGNQRYNIGVMKVALRVKFEMSKNYKDSN